MNLPHSFLLGIVVISALTIAACGDDDRHGPHATHAYPQDKPVHPVGGAVVPSKTETQAKVAGAPSDTAKPAPPGEPAGAAPSKTTENNKVKGAPDDGAQPDPRPESTRAIPPEKSPSGGKDATP